ncbi:hypothetical protein [Streptomyces solaniscabiei]|uniref:hypothetical protein n=1 Tax=Streptomyces solaniscabiei TaxID=2683255 RepID=UPI001CE27D0C|nr:hypothetical protein [Streptomyces solaniscabiei]
MTRTGIMSREVPEIRAELVQWLKAPGVSGGTVQEVPALASAYAGQVKKVSSGLASRGAYLDPGEVNR